MAYSPVEWNTGDVITAAKLNNMDDGIVSNETAIDETNGRIDEIGTMTKNPGSTTNVNAGRNTVNTFDLDEGVYIISETVILNKSLQGFNVSHELTNADSAIATIYHTAASTNYGTITDTFVVTVGAGGGTIYTYLTLPSAAESTTATYVGAATKLK